MILVAATGNAGKLRELQALLADPAIALRSLADYPELPPVVEDGDTFLANARRKAHAVARHTGLPALADDSGLAVDALGGLPGVRSARFAADAGAGRGDAANVALLLERLRGVPAERRSARFHCAVVVARPDGRELVAEGTCEGRIAEAPRGSGGFGYDPVFLFGERTFAELSAAEKDRVSHRARAIAALRPRLKKFLSAS
ncbi:MAG TPA: RdgB/HAM1 family non-canonical purine NTP pyrophosphatase [Candidatus Dormibacteraeota bacterium]|nr:RdgB/HAM1 family non-canonical purine NTP pyrophosphatase [Candidatus Dormibacteraeota bacterium]